ncbi:MAG: toll/interleukin-1 receptor domain-containing protein, partial [Acidobacteriaceae bacterium]
MGRAIFISYRRDDTEGEAGRLFDDLIRAFGDNSVFMDVAGINPGIDFRKAIDDNVAGCGVLLAMIGPTWATITSSSGERRLDDANDFVRLEIGAALARDIAVIPVLVHDAKMPRPDQLPENLKNLAYRNSVEITHARWNSDVQLLTQALSQYVTATSSTDREPVHATVAVQLPPPHSSEPHPAPAKSSKMPLMVGIGGGVVLAIVGIIFFTMHHSGGTAATPPIQPAPAAAPVQASSLVGRWQNSTNVEENGLDVLDITASGNQLSIEAWGNCQPKDCDWGGQATSFDGQKASATWKFTQVKKKSGKEESRVATLTITPVNGTLQV